MSQKFCNLEVLITKYNNPMLSDKGTNIFSEIGKFFKENDATSAMSQRAWHRVMSTGTDDCNRCWRLPVFTPR